MEKVHEGNSLYVDGEFEEAVARYTQALETLSENADVYARRAQAHLQLDNHLDAAEDAGKALELDPKMAKAHLRKGIACFHLDEFESARSCFLKGAELEPQRTVFKTWARKCDAEIADEMSDDEIEEPIKPPASTTTASKPSPSHSQSPSSQKAMPSTIPTNPQATDTNPSKSAPVPQNVPLASAATPQHEGKYRHQWYETQSHVYLQVFAKKMTQDRVEVKMAEESCTILTKSEEGEQDYELNLNLKGQIIPGESKYEILSTKIELKLKKVSDRTWSSLEKDASIPEPHSVEKPASYPSSYRRKVVDWNKLEQDVKTEEENDKLEGDAAVQKLFKQIYAGADEDTRRAMNKSFVESNGTVLSTNWSEVGTKKVECTPPSGMESKPM